MSIATRESFHTEYFQNNHANTPASHVMVPRRKGTYVISAQNVDETPIEGDASTNHNSPVVGLEYYNGRLMGGLCGGDILVVPEKIYESTRQVRDYMDEIGLYRHFPRRFGIRGLQDSDIIPVHKPDNIYTSHAIIDQLCGENKDLALESIFRQSKSVIPFIYSKNFQQLISQVTGISEVNDYSIDGNYIASEILNHKGEALKALHQKGVRTVEGSTVYTENNLVRLFRDLKQRGYESVGIKLPQSASGYGIIKVTTEEELEMALKDDRVRYHLDPSANFAYKGKQYNMLGVRVEGWMEDSIGRKKIVASPGIVVKVGVNPIDDEIYAATDQLLEDGKTHLGNCWPLEYWNKEMDRSMKKVANWARELGYFGVLGVDFIVVEEKGDVKPYLVEVNGRITGQTHAAMFMKNVSGSAFREDMAWLASTYVHIPKNMDFNDFVGEMEERQIDFVPSTYNGEEGKVQGIFRKKISPKRKVADVREEMLELHEAANICS